MEASLRPGMLHEQAGGAESIRKAGMELFQAIDDRRRADVVDVPEGAAPEWRKAEPEDGADIPVPR